MKLGGKMGNKPKNPLDLSSDPDKGADEGIFIKGFGRIEAGPRTGMTGPPTNLLYSYHCLHML